MSSAAGFLPSYTYTPHSANLESKLWPEAPITNESLTRTAVVIIGGGISGMCVAIDLLVNRNVKNFVVLEKSGGFGGTWSFCLLRPSY